MHTEDMELDALIAELEAKNDENEVIEITTVSLDEGSEDEIDVNVEVAEEELMEDDVLVEDKAPAEVKNYNIGDIVMLTSNATDAAGNIISSCYKNTKVYIRGMKNGCYSFSTKSTGRTSGFLVKPEYIIPYAEKQIVEEAFKPYLILVKADKLDIKSKPMTNSNTLKTIHRDGLYTVVGEKNGWGHLKIGGWIPLEDTKIINPTKI